VLAVGVKLLASQAGAHVGCSQIPGFPGLLASGLLKFFLATASGGIPRAGVTREMNSAPSTPGRLGYLSVCG
jgi:hypothetical protein